MTQSHNTQTEAILQLATETARVASALEQQNLMRRRFMMGVIFGIGTAIGASLIASIVIVLLSRTLSVFGFDANFLGSETQAVIEEQIKSQTPQE
jgi:hypothetical protein